VIPSDPPVINEKQLADVVPTDDVGALLLPTIDH
jgi:hypothetical protein